MPKLATFRKPDMNRAKHAEITHLLNNIRFLSCARYYWPWYPAARESIPISNSETISILIYQVLSRHDLRCARGQFFIILLIIFMVNPGFTCFSSCWTTCIWTRHCAVDLSSSAWSWFKCLKWNIRMMFATQIMFGIKMFHTNSQLILNRSSPKY